MFKKHAEDCQAEIPVLSLEHLHLCLKKYSYYYKITFLKNLFAIIDLTDFFFH